MICIKYKDRLINFDKVIFINLVQREVGACIEFVHKLDNNGRPAEISFIRYDDMQQAKETFENLQGPKRILQDNKIYVYE